MIGLLSVVGVLTAAAACRPPANQNHRSDGKWTKVTERPSGNANRVIEVALGFDNSMNLTATDRETQPFKIDGVTVKNGFAPTIASTETGHRLSVLDQAGNEITGVTFDIERATTRFVDTVNADGDLEGGQVKLDKAPMVFTLPDSPDARTLRLSDVDGTEIARFDMGNAQSIDNTPNYSRENVMGLVGAELNDPTKVDVVFVATKYTDFNVFHADVEKFKNTLFAY
jgi:hypothetical protein